MKVSARIKMFQYPANKTSFFQVQLGTLCTLRTAQHWTPKAGSVWHNNSLESGLVTHASHFSKRTLRQENNKFKTSPDNKLKHRNNNQEPVMFKKQKHVRQAKRSTSLAQHAGGRDRQSSVSSQVPWSPLRVSQSSAVRPCLKGEP